MLIEGTTAFVTGANRGLGRHFAEALLDRGAAKVYAAARNPESVDLPGVVPVRLDITDPAQVAAAAALASDVRLLINNAGLSTGTRVLDGDLADVRLEMETHYFGTLSVTRAFAPVLAANEGGALLNVLSVLSWTTLPGSDAYSAAKAAELALTNGLRLSLAEQKTLVTALHVGYMDTDMAAGVDGPKSDPRVIADLALDGVATGAPEVVADDISRMVRAALSGPLSNLYPSVA
jgi:NAD(P)-dependent dehydrogenase (short-subunit alcohol dehydrogenase family)